MSSAPSPKHGVTIRVQSGQAFVNLRGNATDPAFADSIEQVLGQPLPGTPNTFTSGEHRVYWLGPDEWLVVSDDHAGPELAAKLETCVDGKHASVNDLGGGNVGLLMIGDDTPLVLAKGCTLDFHPDCFGVLQCAQSGLARASVLLGRLDHGNRPAFEIIVRRSFSDYLCRWLAHSARSYGVTFPLD